MLATSDFSLRFRKLATNLLSLTNCKIQNGSEKPRDWNAYGWLPFHECLAAGDHSQSDDRLYAYWWCLRLSAARQATCYDRENGPVYYVDPFTSMPFAGNGHCQVRSGVMCNMYLLKQFVNNNPICANARPHKVWWDVFNFILAFCRNSCSC